MPIEPETLRRMRWHRRYRTRLVVVVERLIGCYLVSRDAADRQRQRHPMIQITYTGAGHCAAHLRPPASAAFACRIFGARR